jgi:two-component system cell cycle sensor histidine kinase/response regulator CckA
VVPASSTSNFEIDPLSVADLISYQRHRNARTISVTLVVLDLLVIATLAIVHPVGRVLLALGLFTAASALATAAILVGRVQIGVFLLIITQLTGQVGVVVVLRGVAILPLFPSVVVMLGAATLRSGRQAWVLALGLAAIGVETWLGLRFGGDGAALLAPVMGGIVLTVAAAVISMMHVRESEHAMALAEERDRLRQRAVDKAIASEARHRLIADSTNDLIALVDEHGRAEYLSSSYERCLGRDLASESGGSLLAAVHVEDCPAMLAALRRARADGHATATVRFGTAEGRYLDYEVRLSRVPRDDGERVAVIGRDVTLRLALEDRIRKAQRMEALDRLASGIAHDFNNLLGVVSSASDMVARNLHSPTAIGDDLQIIQQALDSAKALTQQLLTFSRKQVAVAQMLDVGEVLRRLVDIVQRLVGISVRVELSPVPACPLVKIPKLQLEQIVMNLASNARDAMPGGGRFTLTVRTRPLAPREIGDLDAGTYVEIAAADTGSGIAPDVVPHLFEPFFTTKPESRGTGLGLATCYGIARQCGGTILVETELGRGSTFRVLLPADASVPTPIERELTPPAGRPGQRVLLVDDDPAILKSVGRVLESVGFEVATAATLAEAERLLADGARPLDVLVTDVKLGPERGTMLVPKVRALWPRIRIVVISGYAPEPEATAALLGKQATFLSKPFDSRALLAALGLKS